jgi:hypothetical protein
MTHDFPEHLTIAETVSHYRIGRTKLFSLIGRGEIEAVKLGSRTLVRSASAREFFASLPRVTDR